MLFFGWKEVQATTNKQQKNLLDTTDCSTEYEGISEREKLNKN